MGYVEHCNKHGQYHADYICGDCVEELNKELNELRITLEKAYNVLESVDEADNDGWPVLNAHDRSFLLELRSKFKK
jgi:hypothetical protein